MPAHDTVLEAIGNTPLIKLRKASELTGCTIYGKAELLEKMNPFQGGGDMIKTVTFEKTTYADLPNKLEAGTPAIASQIGLGAAIGIAACALDELLRATKRGMLPPLAVGMGIYLPMALTLLIPVGALIGHFYERWARTSSNPAFAERLGVLMATGLIVGESLFGVAFAAIVGATDNAAPLALVDEFGWAVPLGLAAFIGSILWLYAKTRSDAAKPLAA